MLNFEVFVTKSLNLIDNCFIARIVEADFFGYAFVKRADKFYGWAWEEIWKGFEEMNSHQ